MSGSNRFVRWVRTINHRRLNRRQSRLSSQGYDALLKHERSEVLRMDASWRQRSQTLAARAPSITLLWLPEADDRRKTADLALALQRQCLRCWDLLTDRPAGRVALPAQVRCLPPQADTTLNARYNRLLAQASGDYVLLLRSGDRLAEPHALLMWAEAALAFEQPPVLYADEDVIDDGDRRQQPMFKCDWNQELQRSAHSLGRAYLVRTQLARVAGGLAEALDIDAAEQLLVLRVADLQPDKAPLHVPHVLLHRQRGAGAAPPVPAPGRPAQAQALEKLLQARGERVQVTPSPRAGLHCRYAVPQPAPLVSLIVPTRNGLTLLRQCVDSVLLRTEYPNYELLIVDNGSDDADTLAYLQAVQADARVRVRRDPRPFNYSALNNHAVPDCRGSVIGLLNNDTEVISPGWLDELVGLACRPDVGAAGARLWYGNGTLQHAGVLLGLGGCAGHAHLGLGPDEPGYLGRAWLQQEFSAVTAACLVMRRGIFEAVGGLDEQQLPVDLSDIDLCLKLRRAGLKVIWTPFAELFHHESATRGKATLPEQLARLARERAAFCERWGTQLLNDPAHHPALSLRHDPFAVAEKPRVSLLHPWHPALAKP